MSDSRPLFEVLDRVLIPRLPRAGGGVPRSSADHPLLELDAAAAQTGLDPDRLREAYVSFLCDVAGDPSAEPSPDETDTARRVLREVKFGHLPEDFFDLFLQECRHRQVSPWGRHLWADVRFDEMRRRPELAMGFTIDGFRAHAAAAPDYAGQQRLRWCDSAGNFSDVWLAAEPPAAAEATVLRRSFDQPFTRVATWREYAPYQVGRRGQRTLPERWQRSPAAQLARCAEAIALRAAFPERFAKLYCPEEMERTRPNPPAAPSDPDGSGAPAQDDLPPQRIEPDYDPIPPDNEMGFAMAIIREAEVTGRQVPPIVAHYERQYPGLRDAEPRRFYAAALADIRRRRGAGEQIPPAGLG